MSGGTSFQPPGSRLLQPPRYCCGRYHGLFSASNAAHRRSGVNANLTVLQGPNSTKIVASAKASVQCQKQANGLNYRLEREIADIERARHETAERHRREVERVLSRLERVRYSVSVPLDELTIPSVRLAETGYLGTRDNDREGRPRSTRSAMVISRQSRDRP